MRMAGCDLATAALRVVRDYDGVHRLALAVSVWMQVLANQGGRDEAPAVQPTPEVDVDPSSLADTRKGF